MIGEYLPNNDYKKFAIIFMPRTGSNLLCELLDSHYQVLCHTEVFNPKATYLSRKPHLSIGTKEDRDRNPWAFLKRLYSVNDGARAIGFKMSPTDNYRVLLSVLLNRNIKKVILRRENLLETHVSGLIAQQTGVWVEMKDRGPGTDTGSAAGHAAPSQVSVNVGKFLTYARKVRLFLAGVELLRRASRQKFFHIEYRELKDPETRMRLLEFIGVDKNAKLIELTKKQNPRSLREKIANYEEVKRRLAGTRYEKFLQ